MTDVLRDYLKFKEPSQKQKGQNQKIVKLGQWKELLFTCFEFTQDSLNVLHFGDRLKKDCIRSAESRMDLLNHLLPNMASDVAKYQIRYLWDQAAYLDPKYTGDPLSIATELPEGCALVDAIVLYAVSHPKVGSSILDHLEFMPLAFSIMVLRSAQRFLSPLSLSETFGKPEADIPTSEEVTIQLITASTGILRNYKFKHATPGSDIVDVELRSLSSKLLRELQVFLKHIKDSNETSSKKSIEDASTTYLDNTIGVFRSKDQDSNLNSLINPIPISPYRIACKPTEWVELFENLSSNSSVETQVEFDSVESSPIPLGLFNTTEVTVNHNFYEELFYDSLAFHDVNTPLLNSCSIQLNENSDIIMQTSSTTSMDLNAESVSLGKRANHSSNTGHEAVRSMKRAKLGNK
ncbi:hypothetical protein HDU97_009272 [Phlyctochytrium planicorne]|nr:hypothetical protein HDU97_009272 [Phlyctochytrium planicorne]